MEQEEEFIKAGPNKRVTAYLIDTIVSGLLGGITALLVGTISGTFIAYMYILLKDMRGQSIGKMLVGIRVVDESGQTPPQDKAILRNVYLATTGFLSIFSRWLGLASLAVVIAEYYFMMSNANGQRLGDMSFGTRVQDDRPHVSDTLFLFISLALFIGTIAAYTVLARQAAPHG